MSTATAKARNPIHDRQVHALARSACHESAHAVGAVLAGHVLESCTLRDPDHPNGVGGATRWRTPDRRPDDVLGAGLVDQITALGPVVEVEFAYGADWCQRDLIQVMNSTGCHDRDALTASAGGRVLPWPNVRTAAHELGPVIRELAQELLTVGRLSHSAVATALGVSVIPHRWVRSLDVQRGELAQFVPALATAQQTIRLVR